MAHKEIAQPMVAIMRPITHEDAYNAMQPHFLKEVVRDTYPAALVHSFDIPFLRENAPSGLYIDGYISEILKVNDAAVWSIMLKNANNKDSKNLVKGINANLKNQSLYRQSEMPLAVANHNKGFFGLSVPSVSLAAAYGENIKYCMKDGIDDYTVAPVTTAVGEYFGDPVENIDELLERLHILYPSQGADLQQDSAYNFLRYYRTFENGKGDKCPVVEPTKVLLEAFGKVLETDYQDAFYDRVSL